MIVAWLCIIMLSIAAILFSLLAVMWIYEVYLLIKETILDIKIERERNK